MTNKCLIPGCVQRQHTAAWRPVRVNLVARQQFTDLGVGGWGGCNGGGGELPLLPTPLTVLRHHRVKIKSARPWIIDLVFPSIASFLRRSELSFQLSGVSAFSDAPAAPLRREVAVLLQTSCCPSYVSLSNGVTPQRSRGFLILKWLKNIWFPCILSTGFRHYCTFGCCWSLMDLFDGASFVSWMCNLPSPCLRLPTEKGFLVLRLPGNPSNCCVSPAPRAHYHTAVPQDAPRQTDIHELQRETGHSLSSLPDPALWEQPQQMGYGD